MATGTTKKTTDHEEIRRWAESRNCRPATVEGTEHGDVAGVLRFDCNEPEERLREISWDEFFEKFDKENLELLYQDETAEGSESRFFKFVSRDD